MRTTTKNVAPFTQPFLRNMHVLGSFLETAYVHRWHTNTHARARPTTKRHADIVIPRGGDNYVAINLMVEHIRTQVFFACVCARGVRVPQTTTRGKNARSRTRGAHTLHHTHTLSQVRARTHDTRRQAGAHISMHARTHART